jgi:PAS domain S-box-containing protein
METVACVSEKNIKSVEKFVRETYQLFENSNEGLKSILATKKSRTYFLSYVSSSQDVTRASLEKLEVLENWDEVLELEDMETQRSDDDFLDLRRTSLPQKDLDEALNEMVDVGVLHLYLWDSHYSAWRAEELGLMNSALTVSYLDNRVGRNLKKQSMNRSISRDSFLQGSLAEYAFSNIRKCDFDKLKRVSTWMSNLIASTVHLPFGFIVLDNREISSLLPVVYVNRYFEKTTGFKLSEIAGKDLSFLQNGCKYNLIQELQSAVKNSQPVRFNITSAHSSGIKFSNHLCFKPILDQNLECQYVIGFMRNISNSKLTKWEHDNQDNLIRFIPDQIVVYTSNRSPP